MKSFVISVCLLIITVSAVGINAVYFGKEMDEISALLEELPPADDIEEPSPDVIELYEELDILLEKNEEYFRIFIKSEELRLMVSAIRESGEYYRAKDFPTYLATLKQAKECTEIVRLNESISIGNII